MMHLYEIDSGNGTTYWELYDENYDYLVRIPPAVFDQLLDWYRIKGVRFVLHKLEEYDEYHVTLSSI